MPQVPKKSTLAPFVGKLIMIVIGAVLARVGTYLWTDYIKPNPIYVNIQVFDDSKPEKPLKNVAVWLGLNDVDSKQTGDFGLVRFEVPRKHRKEQVTPKLKLDGYSQISVQGPDKLIVDRGEKRRVILSLTNQVWVPDYL